jgi:hypothetical protein
MMTKDQLSRHEYNSALIACFAGTLIGILVPACVLCLSIWSGFVPLRGRDVGSGPFNFFLLKAALLVCAPGGLLLSFILYFSLRRLPPTIPREKLILLSVLRGALMSFLNIPAAFGAFVVPSAVHLFALFLVSGASAGAWIGWHVYRSHHPESPFLPRYSLGTLLLLAVAWGGLLALFMM